MTNKKRLAERKKRRTTRQKDVICVLNAQDGIVERFL